MSEQEEVLTAEEQKTEDEKAYDEFFTEFSDGEESEGGDEFQDKEPEVKEEAEVEPDNTDWKAESEAYKQRAATFEHKFNSDAGRVSALQKKLDAFENQPQEVVAAKQNETPHDLAEFQEDYPEIYQMMKGMEKKFETELDRRSQDFSDQFAPVQSMIKNNQVAVEVTALESTHPDWREYNPNTNQDFSNWVAGQPEQIREMASSDHSNDVSYILSSYKAQRNIPVNQGVSQVELVRNKRKQQLDNSTATPSRGSATNTPLAEDDFESAFEYYANKKAK